MDVPAFGTFEDSKIGTVAACPDVDQHHAALAGRAEWPGYRNQRRFWTSIDLGHMKLLPIWRGTLYPKPPPMTADSPAASWPACRARVSASVQYCSHCRKIAGRSVNISDLRPFPSQSRCVMGGRPIRRDAGSRREQYCSAGHPGSDQYECVGAGPQNCCRRRPWAITILLRRTSGTDQK